MNFLGINWDHSAGAGLLSGDEIVAAVSEERFTRIKNDMSFPANSIKFCMNFAPSNTLGGVGVATLNENYTAMLCRIPTMSVSDRIREQREVWYPRFYEGKEIDEALVFRNRWVHDQYPKDYWAEYDPSKKKTYSEDSTNIVAEFLGLKRSQVVRIEHHWCHAYYGYYASPFRGERAVIITADGLGDGLNATLSIVEGNNFRRIYATDNCVLGRIYRHMTLLLGMKPLEHEYKVMGLAPYVNSKNARKSYEVFSQLLELKGIEFVWKNRPKDSYFYFQEKLQGHRFDYIAAGLQMWIEHLLCQWVTNIIRETKIKTIVFSGGVAMNIKAMGKIAALPCVEKMFVPGAISDESNCIGAAIGAKLHFNSNKMKTKILFPGLYLGPNVEDDEDIFSCAANDPDLVVKKNIEIQTVAELLAKGLVIGRCCDRMEFGQRALGNRSILADPTIPDIIFRINTMIKNRDFWMPFAPVILESYVNRYLINPKQVQSPHMTIGFHTTEEGWKCMRFACHPADRTARAQILKEEDNPEFYKLLKAFEKITGRGALLNTSFNLHGYPIVNTVREAYEVFKSTNLEGLLLRGGLILKKDASKKWKI
ncbi:MAG: hypothetical protein AMJ78_01055 [Omnitrophica WOR_2 bacterium SM23_29]|nr:MAG: hypothetical protein AMJ78_01055 [Omnitrophica WOR_2 bacterium SM23_29]